MNLRQDAERILELAAGDPSFRDVAAARMAEARSELMLATAGGLDGFVLAAMRFFALGSNAHSRAIANDIVRVVPLRLAWLSDGPCVIEGDPGLIGARLLAIGGVGIDEVFRAMRPWLAGPYQRARVIAGMMLAWPPAVAAAAGKGEAAEYLVTLLSGTERKLQFGWADLVPATELYPPRDPGPVPAMLAASGLAASFAEARGGAFLRHLEAGLPYLRLGDLSARSPKEIAATLDAFLDEIGRASGLIVDLRGNPGGDFFGAADFAKRLRPALGARAQVAVLVDKFTFSAALVSAALLKFHAGALLVGEEMGDDAKFWAEGGQEVLPVSGLTIRHCDGWHDWETGIADPVLTPKEIAERMVPVGSLLPDLPVPLTAQDIAAGRDPVLAAARNVVSGRAQA